MTILFILSLFFGFIGMNIKVIEQPQLDIFSESSTAAVKAPNHLSNFLSSIGIVDGRSTDLPILLSNLKPPVPFEGLQIKLHGIVYNGPNDSYALISRRGGIQEVYQTGSIVFKHTLIVGVAKDQIEIDYYGESWILRIEQQRNQYSESTTELTNENIRQQGIIRTQERRRNPIRLLLIRRPYAVYRDGQFLGYKIMPGSNADQFVRLGFESGDVITSLNGISFDGPGMQRFIIDELTHSRNIDLVVLRGKDQLSIMYGF